MLLSDKFNYSNYQLNIPITERGINPLLLFLDIPSGLDTWTPQGIGIVFIYLFIRFFRKKSPNSNSAQKICIYTSLFLLYFESSLFPWKYLGNYFKIIQFPWRLYVIITLLLLFAFSFKISSFINTKKSKIRLLIILSIFSLFTLSISTLYLFRYGTFRDYKHYSIMGAEYIPIDAYIDKYEERGDTITHNSVNVDFIKKGTTMKINYSDNKISNNYIELPLMYYKGYVAIQDNEYLKLEKGTNCVIRIYLNKKSGTIDLHYGMTNVRKV